MSQLTLKNLNGYVLCLRKMVITPVTIGTKYLWTAAGWFDYMNMRINGYNFHMDLMLVMLSYEDPRLDDVFDKWAELSNAGYYLEDHASLHGKML